MPSPATCRHAEPDARIAAQRAVIARFEAALWEGGFNDRLLASYQAAWRRLEALLAQTGTEARHHFLIVIPVADSPVHLRDCLQSLLELCRTFGYGGQEKGYWRKVTVLLADDSGDAEAVARHRAIARSFDQGGLTTRYFGLPEQLALLERLSHLDLAPIVGRHDRQAFHHKGQAMMRNIAYLKCAEMAAAFNGEPWLIYTVDADQAFKVKVATAEGGRDVAAVNFLFHLDAIFSRPEVQVLTGKVVGDPPVSPAVMAGNFLADVIGFVAEMAAAEPGLAYRQPDLGGGGDAAYHDMPDLFGFKGEAAAYRYRCPLPGEPDNAACFADFARRLNGFFHGEHPTRVTWFEPGDAQASVAAARTVYTGNYVFRPEALGWFIPFAPLRLRMSGPTMGRMLRAELNQAGAEGFVAANLPMLHARTLEETGQSEFRPGVVDEECGVDLCGEFERQFHGDVMLFAMEHLTALGYPPKALARKVVTATLEAVRGEMRRRYGDKQEAILARLTQLDALLDDPTRWWNHTGEHAAAVARFHAFSANIRRNFAADSPCYARIDAPHNWEAWRERQTGAITAYQSNRRTWEQALATFIPPRPLGEGRGVRQRR
jgi:hypothetical protein